METGCLRVREVAERLSLSTATVYRLCAERKLAHVRLGARRGAIRIREQDLQVFLDACEVRPSASPARRQQK